LAASRILFERSAVEALTTLNEPLTRRGRRNSQP
jgi:hypothetical protein